MRLLVARALTETPRVTRRALLALAPAPVRRARARARARAPCTVIPTLPLYGKAIGLSSAVNGIVISAPAVALLVGARAAGAFADRARKPAMIGGMALIAFSDVGTAFATSLGPLVVARLGLGAGRSAYRPACVCVRVCVCMYCKSRMDESE